MYDLFTTRQGRSSTEGGSITEGIGLGRVTPIIDDIKVDKRLSHPRRRGRAGRSSICSSTRASASAARPASMSRARSGSPRISGPGKTIVTVLADYGTRYQSKLFNPDFLRSKNLPVPAWLEKRTEIDVPFEKV